MVSSRQAITIISDTLQRSSKLPKEMSYVLREPDPDGEDASVSVPVVVLQDTETNRDDPSHTNLRGYMENDSGERIGRIYRTSWEMSLQIDIWTAAGSDYNADNLGRQLHEILYAYDTRGPDKTFVKEDGEHVDQIYDFALQDGSRNDSLDQTPSVRRWRQTARVRGVEQLTEIAEEPPVRKVTQE